MSRLLAVLGRHLYDGIDHLLRVRRVEEVRAALQQVQLRLLGPREQLDLLLGDLGAVDRIVGALAIKSVVVSGRISAPPGGRYGIKNSHAANAPDT